MSLNRQNPHNLPNLCNPLFNLPRILPGVSRRFTPPHPELTPRDLFSDQVNGGSIPALRNIRNGNRRQLLIYIDGSCLNNGQLSARAGYGIKWGPHHSKYSGRLEGTEPETSNRAELRAAIVSLGLRIWNGEGFDTVVLAADSEYVVKGICERVETWQQRGWRTSSGSHVMNQDLWRQLLEKLQECDERGLLVQFWQIPRDLNEADPLAREGARKEERPEDMRPVMAVDV